MVRRGKYTKGGKKASYLNEDNKRYHTLKILKKGTAMTQTRLMEQQQLLTSQWRGFATILNQMVEWEWIENVDSPADNIKLLGITELINNELFERVHPCLVPNDSYIGNINGVMNAVILDSKPVGQSVLQGEGAGPGPTSSALMSDLLSILSGNIKYPFGIPFNERKKINYYDKNQHSNSMYLRFEVKDKPGVLSSITKIFAKNKISIKNLIQKPNKKYKKASIIIITHKNLEKNYNNLLSNLYKNKFILTKPTYIRIEK